MQTQWPAALAQSARPRINVVHIRPERPDDAGAISMLIQRAFASAPHSSGHEQYIVPALRQAGVLTVSLVAEEGRHLQGHIAFSAVSVMDGAQGWYGLGPVAVEPSVQRLEIGSLLVRAGLAELRGIGAAGCVVLGEPEYYGRLGFAQVATLRYPGPPPKYFMAQSFGGPLPVGEVSYHGSFTAEV